MPSKYFSFSKKEICLSFALAKLKNKIEGLKLLQFPIEKIKKLNLDDVNLLSPSQIENNVGKLLIITSRKIGKAHKRNKLRRRLKSIFYEEQLYKYSVISIVITYKQAINMSFTELKKFMLDSFEKNNKI